MTPLERVTERVERNGDPNDPETPSPMLTLAEFFDGNQIVGSIGCNLAPAPTPAAFREMLEAVAKATAALDVRIEVAMFDDPDWPFSEAAWLFYRVRPTNLEALFPENWAPDEISEEPLDPTSHEAVPLPPGTIALRCWWD